MSNARAGFGLSVDTFNEEAKSWQNDSFVRPSSDCELMLQLFDVVGERKGLTGSLDKTCSMKLFIMSMYVGCILSKFSVTNLIEV